MSSRVTESKKFRNYFMNNCLILTLILTKIFHNDKKRTSMELRHQCLSSKNLNKEEIGWNRRKLSIYIFKFWIEWTLLITPSLNSRQFPYFIIWLITRACLSILSVNILHLIYLVFCASSVISSLTCFPFWAGKLPSSSPRTFILNPGNWGVVSKWIRSIWKRVKI